jgi:hypothetical protein
MADGTFGTDTRTSIQQRIEKTVAEKGFSLPGIVKMLVESEFDQTLQKGNTDHERRFVRALLVSVAHSCLEAGIALDSVGNGVMGMPGAFVGDLQAAGKLPGAKPKVKFNIINGGVEEDEVLEPIDCLDFQAEESKDEDEDDDSFLN